MSQLEFNGTTRRGRADGRAAHPSGQGVCNARPRLSESPIGWRPAPAMRKLPAAIRLCQSCTHPPSRDGSFISMWLPCVSDPDSDIDGGRSPRRMEEDLHGGPAGAQEEDTVPEQEDRPPPEV